MSIEQIYLPTANESGQEEANILIKDIKDSKKFSASNVSIKTERKAPLIHCSVGKVSQKQMELK